jgi:hypothetical protein
MRLKGEATAAEYDMEDKDEIDVMVEATGGHGASTASVYLLLTEQMRDSGLPADVLVGKLNKDISFALRRGTIAQVTTSLDAGQRALVRRG